VRRGDRFGGRLQIDCQHESLERSAQGDAVGASRDCVSENSHKEGIGPDFETLAMKQGECELEVMRNNSLTMSFEMSNEKCGQVVSKLDIQARKPPLHG
jgi:hypothetical protein